MRLPFLGRRGRAAAPPRRQRLAGWFALRTLRERVLIVSACLLVAGSVVHAGLYQPIVEARATPLADIARYESAITRVRAAGPALAEAPAAAPVPPASAVTDTAKLFGLTIRRLEPEGALTRVVVDDAEFEALITWLDRLEHDHALRIAAIELDRRPPPGIVSARITLEN